jgi:hypothetical protein
MLLSIPAIFARSHFRNPADASSATAVLFCLVIDRPAEKTETPFSFSFRFIFKGQFWGLVSKYLKNLVSSVGFEPTTPRLKVCASADTGQLSAYDMRI